MVKLSSSFVCQQCGFKSASFLGKCPQCDSWNSFVETIEQPAPVNRQVRGFRKAEVVDLSKIEKVHYQRLPSGILELDRVLGGGIVKGSIILVAGDPGIGKSTLLLQMALQQKKDGLNHCLYVAGEESPQQIKIRADRIKKGASLSVLNETNVDIIIDSISQLKPELVIVDSIQTLQTDELSSVAGSVSQVRESAHRLQRLAKLQHIPIFLVGHVTKEGTVAGPKTLEHLVDVVLSLEGDPSSQFRVLRSTKNRFGSTDEVGIFEMEDKGMVEVANPSRLFLEQKVNAPGSAVVPILNGLRPLMVEIQALVTKSNLPIPRRTGSGIDNNRLQLLVAVLQKRLSLPLFDQDIFVNVTGGLKVTETAADLAICLAVTSSLKDKTIDPKTALVGEVGLLGEIRTVRQLDKRVIEAKKLGFNKVISPENVKTLSEAAVLTIGR